MQGFACLGMGACVFIGMGVGVQQQRKGAECLSGMRVFLSGWCVCSGHEATPLLVTPCKPAAVLFNSWSGI